MTTSACWNSPIYVWLTRALSNRDLFGGRRARRRQRDRQRTTDRLCKCCGGRQRSSRWCCSVWRFGHQRLGRRPVARMNGSWRFRPLPRRQPARWRRRAPLTPIRSGPCARSVLSARGREEAGHLSSPAEASLDCNADYRSSKSPRTAPTPAKRSTADRPPEDPQLQTHADQEADKGSEVNAVQDDYRALRAMPRARIGLTRCWMNSMPSARATVCEP